MSGTLHVVATPIGNLEDITLRALRVLREVAVVAAEDTRRTAKLLNHYAIATPVVSFHAHNTRRRVPELIRRLQDGQAVALVSDAGTPIISDPGLELVRACIDDGIPVDPLPGASAPLAALVASGFSADPFMVAGFAPNRSKDRVNWVSDLGRVTHTVVLFESPHRIHDLIGLFARFIPRRDVFIGREITKIHQEFIRSTGADLVNCHILSRGEFTIVIGPAGEPTDEGAASVSETLLADEFHLLTKSGELTRRQAVSELARRHALPSRQVYAALEHVKAARKESVP